MTDELKNICKQLKDHLSRLPTKQKSNFKMEAVNNGKVEIHGLRKDKYLLMDQVNLDNSVETRWCIQNKSIQFVIYNGDLELHFRLNENVHIKQLSVTQSLRIPFGIPFMLKTLDKKCAVLLISSLEDKKEA